MRIQKSILIPIAIGFLISCHSTGKIESLAKRPEDVRNLSLTNCGLTKVPSDVQKMVYLEDLILFRNKIDSIPSFIGELQKLEELSFQSNRLTFVSPETGSLTKLRKLNLRFNRITAIPEEISKLSSLVELDLRNNNLKSLPENLGDLSNLEYLYLNDNDIEALPASMVNLKKLRLLHIGRNHLLEGVPDFIGELSSLIELDVSRCGEDANLPSSLGKLQRLEILYISSYQVLPYELGRGNPRLQIILK